MILERSIEENLTEYAKDQGVLVLKLNVKYRRGWPDRLFLKNGGILFIEVKRPGEEPTLIQEHVHGLIRSQGFAVVVVDNFRDGRAAIDELVKICPDI